VIDQKAKELIISALKETVELIKKDDFSGLKELSNKTIGDVSTIQEKHAVRVAVVVYALAKILQRTQDSGQSISINVSKRLERAAEYIELDDEEGFDKEMKNIFKQISIRDEKLLMYVQQVIEKANTVKGSKMYGSGISMGKAAQILGINQWDLMSFVGKTRIADAEEDITDIKKRLLFTKRLFKVL